MATTDSYPVEHQHVVETFDLDTDGPDAASVAAAQERAAELLDGAHVVSQRDARQA